jgi:hypothetical protein
MTLSVVQTLMVGRLVNNELTRFLKLALHNFDAPSRHLTGGTEENHLKPQSGYPDSCRDLNPESPECEAGVLPTCSTKT